MKDDCGQKTVNIHLDKDNQPFFFFEAHSALSEITNSDPDGVQQKLKGTSLTVCESGAALPSVFFCLFKQA